MPQSPVPSTLNQESLPKTKSTDEYQLLADIGSTNRQAPPPETIKQSWRDGHHFGVLCGMISAIVVLLFNVITCILATTKYKAADNLATLYDGDCDKVKRLDWGLHLLINILSTVLLGASNYSMQCICAPTRIDIDNAHRKHLWMDIGVPSIRNLRFIPWPRKILWCCLVLSSVPLHLMYNSVLYSSLSETDSMIFLVTDDFLAGASYDPSDQVNSHNDSDTASRLNRLRTSTSVVRLDNRDCQKVYGSASGNSIWGDGLVITTTASTNNSLLMIFDSSLCSDDSTCNGGSIVVDGYPVSHCLGMKTQQHCKLKSPVGLMISVIACNLIKIICMGYIVFRLDPRPLVTLGDALASFLDSPDPTTTDKCLVSISELQNASNRLFIPRYYFPQRHRRFSSASRMRWLTVSGFCIVTLLAAAGLLSWGILHAKSPEGMNYNNISKSLFGTGLGAIDTRELFEPSRHTVVSVVLLANVPQLVLSFMYFALNGLWTCILLVQEWNGYSIKRKALRVTSPTGLQRSTYRLQLPYRYGVPFMIVSALLHWLVSQSLYIIVREDYTNDNIMEEGNGQILCGYASLAILVASISILLVLLASVVQGIRRYPRVGIPLAGSCSAAISAACHPPPNDDRPSIKTVMWGAIKEESSNAGEEHSLMLSPQSLEEASMAGNYRRPIGHCTFTSLPVEEPIRGELYAGLRQRR